MKHPTNGILTALVVVLCGCGRSERSVEAKQGVPWPPARLIESGWKASWSPDGTKLVYGRPGGTGLEVLNLRTLARTELAATGKDPEWSPDGRYIAYVQEPAFNAYAEEGVWVVEVHGGNRRKLVAGGFPTWSADGKTLFMTDRRANRILAVEVDADPPPSAVFFENARSWYPAVSPDGTQIAFGRREMLEIVDRMGGRIVLSWPTPGNRGLLPAWSPDGRLVAFGGFDDATLGLWVLDLKTAKAARVIEGPFTMPAWSKDGKRLAFDQRRVNQREVWFVSRDWVDERLKQTGRLATEPPETPQAPLNPGPSSPASIR